MSRSVSAPSSVTKTSPCWNGDIVPGSTLTYGSNFCSVTLKPRASSRAPMDAAAIPLPSPLTTPPVMKMYLVLMALLLLASQMQDQGTVFCGETCGGGGGRVGYCGPKAHFFSRMSRLFRKFALNPRHILGTVDAQMRLVCLDNANFKTVLQRAQLF